MSPSEIIFWFKLRWREERLVAILLALFAVGFVAMIVLAVIPLVREVT